MKIKFGSISPCRSVYIRKSRKLTNTVHTYITLYATQRKNKSMKQINQYHQKTHLSVPELSVGLQFLSTYMTDVTILIGQIIVDCHLYLQHCKPVHGVWPEWEHIPDSHAWSRCHHHLGGWYNRSAGSRLFSQWLCTGINSSTHQTKHPKIQ